MEKDKKHNHEESREIIRRQILAKLRKRLNGVEQSAEREPTWPPPRQNQMLSWLPAIKLYCSSRKTSGPQSGYMAAAS